MEYDARLMVVRELFPTPVLIDRKPVEDDFGRLVPPPHLRGPDIEQHGSSIRELFAFSLVAPKGQEINEDRLADILLKRNAEEVSPLHRLLKIPVEPDLE